MIIECLPVGPIQTNCYLVACPETLDAAVIDPGGDADVIVSRARALSLRVVWIINTHGHGDHIAANADLKSAFPDARLAVHEADAAYLGNSSLNLSASLLLPVSSPPADMLLKAGDDVNVGKIAFKVIHVPGHTPGGIALYTENGDGAPILLCGDTIFAGGIGRADLPGGSLAQLVKSIRERLLSLPSETAVYPGHGEPTTIGREAASNPYLT